MQPNPYQGQQEPVPNQRPPEPVPYQGPPEPVPYQGQQEPVPNQRPPEPIPYLGPPVPMPYPVPYPMVAVKLAVHPYIRAYRRQRRLILFTGICIGLYAVGQHSVNQWLEDADLGAVCCWALCTASLIIYLLVFLCIAAAVSTLGGLRSAGGTGLRRLLRLSPGLVLITAFVLWGTVDFPAPAFFLLLWVGVALIQVNGVIMMPSGPGDNRMVLSILSFIPPLAAVLLSALGVHSIIGALMVPAMIITVMGIIISIVMGRVPEQELVPRDDIPQPQQLQRPAPPPGPQFPPGAR